MLVHETPLEGAALIELEAAEDERGFFARSFCRGEFEAAGLEPVILDEDEMARVSAKFAGYGKVG